MTQCKDVSAATARPRWRTWIAGGFIAAYLTAIGFGLFCHTFRWNLGLHPMMYYVVWDMFCGWAAYECRYHVIAEGVSGRHYQVLPGPWGDFRPFGDISRHHYDPDAASATRMAMNVLRHTRHEEITRLFVVEENWPKKFNMPDDQWAARWDEPKDPKRYYTLRQVVTPEGVLLQAYDNFYVQQGQQAVLANPRLAAEATRSQPFYAVNLRQGFGMSETFAEKNESPRFGSPLGN
jgi:hypothetical protein